MVHYVLAYRPPSTDDALSKAQTVHYDVVLLGEPESIALVVVVDVGGLFIVPDVSSCDDNRRLLRSIRDSPLVSGVCKLFLLIASQQPEC